MIVYRAFLALGALLLAMPAWACTPLAPSEQAGFARPDVGRLPRNARGVMFYPGQGGLRARDVELTSGEASGRHRGPLAIRVRAFKDMAWVRLEPVHGFQPGVRYHFRYLAQHGSWAYPDAMSVLIDPKPVATDGEYAIALAPRPTHRVIIVPTNRGSCVTPAPALVQAFSFSVPPALRPYREHLAYINTIRILSAAGESPLSDTCEIALGAPDLYAQGNHSLGLGFSRQYSTYRNAVVADCHARQPRMRLRGLVMFPEVDGRQHRMPAQDIDLNNKAEGQCDELDALVRSVDWRSPESSLREVCQMSFTSLTSSKEQPMRATRLEDWESAIILFSGMESTCHVVALSHLWHAGQYSTSPQTLHRIGTAFARAFHRAAPAERRAALRALVYLVDHLPPATRASVARQLLAPVQPALVAALDRPGPIVPADLARLIGLDGGMTPAVREKLRRLGQQQPAS